MSENTYQIPVITLPWRPWFAWRPVTDHYTQEALWLRRIWRRRVWFIGVALTDYAKEPDYTENQVENTT